MFPRRFINFEHFYIMELFLEIHVKISCKIYRKTSIDGEIHVNIFAEITPSASMLQLALFQIIQRVYWFLKSAFNKNP